MKLLIVINQFYKGGAETNLLNLLKGCLKRMIRWICWFTIR